MVEVGECPWIWVSCTVWPLLAAFWTTGHVEAATEPLSERDPSDWLF